MRRYGAYLVCYDVADPRRLRRVARLMERHGTRVQRSVFVCRLTAAQKERLAARLGRLILPASDAVSLYALCARCEETTAHLGVATVAPPVPVCIVA